MYRLPSLLAVGLFSVGAAYASINFDVATDAGSNFTTGGWSGDGSVSASFGGSGSAGTALVTGFSSGTLTVENTAGGAGNSQSIPAGGWGTIENQIMLSGGTGDIVINSLPGPHPFGGIQISNLSAGVDQIMFQTTYLDQWIGAVDLGFKTPNGDAHGTLPWLAAMEMNAGENVDLTMSITDIITLNDLSGTNYTVGAPVGASLHLGANSDFTSNPLLTSQSNIMTASGSGNFDSGWQHAHGADLNNDGLIPFGPGNGMLDEAETVYAKTIKFTVRPSDGSTFNPGAGFFFSFDGGQWVETPNNINNIPSTPYTIPEPSRVMLFGLALGCVVLRRRR